MIIRAALSLDNMEDVKFWTVASLAFVLVLCITSTTVTWHCLNEVARLQSRVERLEAEDKGSSISEFLGQLGVQTSVYQGGDGGEDISNHHRPVRQLDGIVRTIVRQELEAHLNCPRDNRTKCTIEPGPQGDPGPPGPLGATGPPGDKGEQGMQGYPGFKGQEGAKGEMGDQGRQGLKGERGERGDMGPQGPVGEKGEIGDTGPVGPMGAKGMKGQLGHTGYKGQKGEVGEQGDKGPAGERGEKGDIGPRGPSGGEKGEPGRLGPQGLTGGKGEKGQHGYPGYKGEKGATGDKGDTGMIGEKGVKGDTGADGPVGEKGATGAQGPQGQKGERGEGGEKGDMGPRGPVGENGTKGDTGPAGKQGPPGEHGPKGEKGTNPLEGQYICGGTTGWIRVAYIDMTIGSHQCPGDMQEATLSGKRVCGRSAAATRPSCISATFPTSGLLYSKVCGRIRGYQYGDPDAFLDRNSPSIESQYVDGISLTHGPSGRRQHVWTFATGVSEEYSGGSSCPCAPNAVLSSIRVPSFVGQDYFCESGVRTGIPPAQLYTDDPLWDGDGCKVAGNTCCQFNTPPYFTKHLNTTTTDDLEVRTCGYYTRNSNTEDTLVELIELYIKA